MFIKNYDIIFIFKVDFMLLVIIPINIIRAAKIVRYCLIWCNFCCRAKYFTDLVKHESFLQLDEEHLKALLTDDELLIQSEDAVLLAAIAWLEANISHESTHAFSELIEDVLRCVRFEFCTTWKMYRLLMNDGFARSISTSLHGPMLMACMCKFAPDDQKIDILWRNDRAVTGKNMISVSNNWSL